MTCRVIVPRDCHSRPAGMACINHWIPRRPVPDAALPPASMQASLRWNDGGAEVRNSAGMAKRLSGQRPAFSLPAVIYGHAYRDVSGRAASGTSRRGSPVCPACCRQGRESTPTGTYACMDAGGRAAPVCCRQVWNERPRRARPGRFNNPLNQLEAIRKVLLA